MQAIPKGDRGELAVEVLTEVGVARIVPWAASRSVAVWKGERAEKSLARWRTTAREASKQARRPWFAEVGPMATTAEVVALVTAADLAVVLHEEAASSLGSLDVPSGWFAGGSRRPRGRSQRRGGRDVRGRRRARRTSRERGAAHLHRRRRCRGRVAVADPALGRVSNRPMCGLADR